MIRFHYRYPGFRVRPSGKIKNWLYRTSAKEKAAIKNLDYIFVSDQELLQINRQTLQHDYFTDILTFPESYKPIIGVIYISVDRIREQAITYQVSLHDELRRIMVHGLLHLCGYKDNTRRGKEKMTTREDFYLGK